MRIRFDSKSTSRNELKIYFRQPSPIEYSVSANFVCLFLGGAFCHSLRMLKPPIMFYEKVFLWISVDFLVFRFI